MVCEVCGTELPREAMFCAECGSAVGGRSMRSGYSVPSEYSNSSEYLKRPEYSNSPEPVNTGNVKPERSDQDTASQESQFGPRETVAIHPDDVHLGAEPVQDPETEPPPGLWQSPVLQPWLGDDPEPRPDPQPGLDYSASVRPRFAPLLKPDPRPDVPAGTGGDIDGASGHPDSFPWGSRGSAIFTDSDELEKTLIVPRRAAGERFTLQFSTGESVTVFGSGLLGRNPTPQPGEFFDQLVGISDPGKSVSKTHLEFGQESGSFWVSDRYSGNGSVVREPEAQARRLVPGLRYRIVRGTRVDVGEQFFVVS